MRRSLILAAAAVALLAATATAATAPAQRYVVTALAVAVHEQWDDSPDPGSTFTGSSQLGYALAKATQFRLASRAVSVSLPVRGSGTVEADYVRTLPVGAGSEHESCSSTHRLPARGAASVHAVFTQARANVRLVLTLRDLPVPAIGGTGDDVTGVPCYEDDAHAFGTFTVTRIVRAARLARAGVLRFTGRTPVGGEPRHTRAWTAELTLRRR